MFGKGTAVNVIHRQLHGCNSAPWWESTFSPYVLKIRRFLPFKLPYIFPRQSWKSCFSKEIRMVYNICKKCQNQWWWPLLFSFSSKEKVEQNIIKKEWVENSPFFITPIHNKNNTLFWHLHTYMICSNCINWVL